MAKNEFNYEPEAKAILRGERTRGDRPLVERYLEPGGLFPTMHGRVTAPSC